MIPVNPYETEVYGQKAYPTLESVEDPIDLVNVFRRSDQTPQIARSAVAISAATLWLQEGVINEQAARIAADAGMAVVMDQCILVAHRRIGLSRAEPHSGQG